MSNLPEGCVHRWEVGMPHITCEKASVGMKVVYLADTDRAEVGVIQSFTQRTAHVLYLGDRTAKLTSLNQLTYWDGPS